MARQVNFFALLEDGEGDEDVSALIERVSAVKVEPAFADKKKKEKQQRKEPPVKNEESDWSLNNAVLTKGIEHVRRRDVNKQQSEGQEREQGLARGPARSKLGGNGYRRSFGGADGYRQNDGRQNHYQLNNRVSDGYHRKHGGDSYHVNIEGENNSQRDNGVDSGDADRGDWQELGQGHRRGGGGRGRGRGRGRGGRGFNHGYEIGSESQDIMSNHQIGKQGPEGNDDGCQEQNGFEAQNEERPRNVNQGLGGYRRGYGGRSRGFRGQEGRPYDRRDGRDNRRSELSNDSEVKEIIGGDMGNEKKVEDCSSEAKWDVPVTTEEPTDAVHEQGKLESQDNSEKKAKDTDDVEKVIMEMTLEEYEKVLFEKRKALEALSKTEERKVTLDKDLESMQLVEKRKNDSLFIKSSEKEKLKKKGSLEKDDKVRKSMSINEFLKPAEGEWPVAVRGHGRGRGRGRGAHVEYRGEFLGRKHQMEADPAPSFEDQIQFPVLRGAAEA